MTISIKNRIYLSFALLVFLFIVNGLITISTSWNNKKLSDHISRVVDPSLEALNDFKQTIIESKMYSTNWVFLRYNENDKAALIKLHGEDYQKLKSRLSRFSKGWNDSSWRDSLNLVHKGFEGSLNAQKGIMTSLVRFEDYDNPVIKFEAERIVEDEIIPQTAALIAALEKIIRHEADIRIQETKSLDLSSANLRALITFLAITFICLGVFLSFYFGKIIIIPINKIKNIVNDLGKGITRIIEQNAGKDEIGEMIHSVNNLSQKLQRTATFAREVGTRNFDIPFEPLSEEDTLGKALVAMRDNLKQSDAQLNEAQHIAHLGSWERDHKTGAITWSDEMFLIFEVDHASFEGRLHSFLDHVHPEDLEYVKNYITRNPVDYPLSAYECRIVTGGGNIKTIYVEDKIFMDANGAIIKATGILQDITERKKSSIALELALAQIKTLFENIDQALYSMDVAERKVVQLSSACERIYGYSSDYFLNDFDFWKSRVYKEDLHIINKGLATLYAGSPVHDEYRIVHKDQSIRWVEAKFAPTLDSSGRLIRVDGVVSDIEKRKSAELERDMITADLIQRNKDLEQFTYIISHNLRAPVANIMALSELLNITAADTDNDELLSGLSVSINKLDSIIFDLNKILTVRTPGYEKKEHVSLLSIVQDIEASIKHIIDNESVEIFCDFKEVDALFTLKSYIYSIFYNLILNSIKYKQPDCSPKIEIKSGSCNGKTFILFKDNGKGIDTEKHAKEVFMLYKRLDTTVEGKGIGLYMVKTAIETLGGTISLQSEVNKGCEFKLELPNRVEEGTGLSDANKVKTSTGFKSLKPSAVL